MLGGFVWSTRVMGTAVVVIVEEKVGLVASVVVCEDSADIVCPMGWIC